MITFEHARAGEGFQIRWRQHQERYGNGSVLIPTRSQFDAIKAVGNVPISNFRIFLVTSANGTGKTTATINILANIIFGTRTNIYPYCKDVQTGESWNGFFDFPLYDQWPRGWPKKVWYVGHMDSIKEIYEELINWFPNGRYVERKEGKNYIAKIEVPETGWIIYFKTTSQERRAFESGNVGIVIFDEPPKKWQYDAAIHRTRKGGIIIITATPVFEAGWFVDNIVEKLDIDKDKVHLTVNIHSNSIQDAGEWDLGVYGVQKKGNLEKKQIDFIIRNCDPDEAPARLWGEFVHLSGLVYKSYDREKHWVDIERSGPHRQYMYRMVIDPHDRRPPAVIWLRYDQLGNKHVVREWPSIDDPEYHGKLMHEIKDSGPFSIYDYCEKFIEIEREMGIPVDRISRAMDPNFGMTKKAGLIREVFAEYGVQSEKVYKKLNKNHRLYPDGTRFNFFMQINDDINLGHKLVKEELNHISAGGRLTVSRSCKNVDLCFRRYAYREYELTKMEYSSLSDVLQEKYKDFMDLIRYDAMWPFHYSALPLHVAMEQKGDYDEVVTDGKEMAPADWRTVAREIESSMPERPEGADAF